MIKRSLTQIVSMIAGSELAGSIGASEIHGVSIDTRTIQPNMLYVPLTGQHHDGHKFVADAFNKGASAVLWQRDHTLPAEDWPLILVDNTLIALQQLAHAYRHQLSAQVIGITGSNGKTTTKDMVASILSTTYKTHKTKDNLNTEIGLPLTLLELDEDIEMVVLEMGMRGMGQIKELTDIAQPEVAIITIIGESHLELLGSRENIARAKLEILSGLKKGGLFIYNGDEPLISSSLVEADKPEGMLQYRFGANDNNDIYPVGMMYEEKGMRFTTNMDSSYSYYIPYFGQHNIINALAAIAVAKYMGVQQEDIIHGLRNLKLSGMRIEITDGIQDTVILNDAFNASPTSMRAAIELLTELKGRGRKIVVLADMLELGEQEERYHREIAHLLDPQEIHYVLTCGPLADYIAKEARTIFAPDKVASYYSKEPLIDKLLEMIQPRDMILVKGSRGMAMEEVVERLSKEM